MKTTAKGLLFLSLLSIITTKTENNTEIKAIKEQLDQIAKEKQEKKAKKEQEQKDRDRKKEISNAREDGFNFAMALGGGFLAIIGILCYFTDLKSNIKSLKREIEFLRKYEIQPLANTIKSIKTDVSLLETNIFCRIVNFLQKNN